MSVFDLDEEELWEQAKAHLREMGEDPDEVIARAASNLSRAHELSKEFVAKHNRHPSDKELYVLWNGTDEGYEAAKQRELDWIITGE
jgi:hypothetical protein